LKKAPHVPAKRERGGKGRGANKNRGGKDRKKKKKDRIEMHHRLKGVDLLSDSSTLLRPRKRTREGLYFRGIYRSKSPILRGVFYGKPLSWEKS